MAQSYNFLVLILCVSASFLSATKASDLLSNDNNIITYNEQHNNVDKKSGKTPVNPGSCDINHACPAGATCCCLYEYSGICFSYGCCPFSSATCCDDNYSCCPAAFPVCDIGDGVCRVSANSPFSVKAMPRFLAKPIR